MAGRSGKSRTPPARAAPSPASRESLDRLAEDLTGQVVAAGGASWHIEVYGIFVDRGNRWVQLGLKGPDERSLLLRVHARAGLSDILRTITAWLETCPGDVAGCAIVRTP